MRVLAWPKVSLNSYVEELYEAMVEADPTVEVKPFKVLNAWRSSADLIHVHWPEAAYNSPSYIRSILKTSIVLVTLASHKVRGASVVWTCHNLKAHDQRHPRIEKVARAIFDRMIDGVIHLSPESLTAMADSPSLADKHACVVPHGMYVVDSTPPSTAEARDALGLEPDVPVLGFVGLIRPYKNVTALIESFASMDNKAQLLSLIHI